MRSLGMKGMKELTPLPGKRRHSTKKNLQNVLS